MTYFIGFFAPVTKFDGLIPSGFEPLPVAQRHMTLLYLGSLPQRSEACARLLGLRRARIRVRFQGLRPFPSEAKPRYLAAVPDARCLPLLAGLREELVRLFPEHADRYGEFKPHVSIAYTRRKADPELYEAVARAVRASRVVVDELIVEELCLMSAERGLVQAVCCVSLDQP